MDDAPIPLPLTVPVSRDRFGLADVMILVASLAFGLGWLRMEIRLDSRQEVGWTFYTPSSPTLSNITVVSWLFEATVPIVGSLSFGLALVQLRRLGLFSGSLFGRPGLLACLSASVAVLLYLVRRSVSVLAETWKDTALDTQFATSTNLNMISGRLLVDLAYSAGVAVLATWLVSRLGSSHGARAGATDLAGRLVGIYRLAMIVVRGLLEAMWSFCLGGLI